MLSLTQYLLDMTLVWSVFLVLYIGFLQKETFFSYNRIYLLCSLLIGFLMPFARLVPSFFDFSETDEIIYISQIAQRTTISVFAENTPLYWESLTFWLWVIYSIGVVIFSIRLCNNIGYIRGLERRSVLTRYGDYTLVKTQEKHLPFSFFRKIYVSEKMELAADFSQILRHELAHVRQKHSVDIVIMEMMKVLLWFHPMIYLYKYALRQCHEYLADLKVCSEYRKSDYGRMLIRNAFTGLEMSLANNFFNIHLKKRIKMMYQSRSNKYSTLKYLTVFPLLVLFFFVFSMCQSSHDNVENPESSNEPITLDKASQQSDGVDDVSISAESEVYKQVDQQPVFPGCETAVADQKKECSDEKLLKYLYSNLKYPVEARNQGIEGLVLLQFVIEKDGSVSNIKKLKTIGGGCDEESERVVVSINDLPEKWSPGMVKGKAVRMKYTLPIRFKLES